jgi:hypothetical protein
MTMIDYKDLLAKEIQSWQSFKYALRKENAVLFDQMLKECQEKEGEVQFANAVDSKGEYFAAESLFMILILQQQRMINQIINKVNEQMAQNKRTRKNS